MTINVARQFHQEHRLGSIEVGKIANMTVFDSDFLHDDIEKVAQANIVATIVDGEEVFKAFLFTCKGGSRECGASACQVLQRG